MKKTIAQAGLFSLILCTTAFFMGCDIGSSGSSGSSSSGSVIEVQCVVRGKSNAGLGFEGDLGFYDCGPYRIRVTPNTKIIRERESCSGLASANYADVLIGDILFVKHRTDKADYASNPSILEAVVVEAYPEGCISGRIPSEKDCDTCPDPFFD